MVADDKSLSPEDKRAIAQDVIAELRPLLSEAMAASAKAPAVYPPGRPPADFSGLDVRIIDGLRDGVLREMHDALHDATSSFLPKEEIERRDGEIRLGVERQFADFKRGFLDEMKQAINSSIETEINKLRQEFYITFEDIGLPLTREDGKRRKTAERINDLITMRDASKEWKTEFWKALRASAIGAVVTLILTAVGYIFTRGGQSH